MSTQMTTVFVRCSVCEEMFVPVVNLLTDEPLWTLPKIKRHGCSHSNPEYWDGTQWRGAVVDRTGVYGA